MNILIVGGAGYLGGAVTDLLMNSGHNLLVYDILLYEDMYRKEVPFVLGDVRDREKLKSHLDWADVVIWLAAVVGDPACALNETLTTEVNTESVRFLRENFEGKIIFMSTCSVYGAADSLLDEKSSLNPLSLYARTKLHAEEVLAGSNAIIFRLGTLYGVSDSYSRIRFDLVVNTLVMRAGVHGKISVFGGKQYRPLLHVRDVALIIAKCLESSSSGIYNLHSENVVINEVADRVKKYFPLLEVEITDSEFQDNRNYRVSSDVAKNELSFNPALNIDDGIKELKSILDEGRVKNSFLNRFSNYLHLKPMLREYNSPLGRVIESNM